MAALGQPAGQEFLRPAVGPGRVDVPDPGRVGGVQHRERPGPHAGHAAVGQVLLPAAGDVRRAAQRGQPQPDPRDHRSPSPECRHGHANRAQVAADHGPYRTGAYLRDNAVPHARAHIADHLVPGDEDSVPGDEDFAFDAQAMRRGYRPTEPIPRLADQLIANFGAPTTVAGDMVDHTDQPPLRARLRAAACDQLS